MTGETTLLILLEAGEHPLPLAICFTCYDSLEVVEFGLVPGGHVLIFAILAVCQLCAHEVINLVDFALKFWVLHWWLFLAVGILAWCRDDVHVFAHHRETVKQITLLVYFFLVEFDGRAIFVSGKLKLIILGNGVNIRIIRLSLELLG